MKFRSRVLKKISRSEDVLGISFEKPAEFNFSPGQFLFLTINWNGVELVKHITISSSPSEDFLQITKKLTGHEYSNGLLDLKMNDEVSIDGPYGHFSYIGEPEKVLFVTGGIGITPIHSMIRYCVDKGIKTDLVLLYSCRLSKDIIFRDEFNQIQSRDTKFKIIYTLTRPDEEWKGHTGRINGDMICKLVPDFLFRATYVSGPPSMVDSIVNILVNELNMPLENIKKENFLGL